MKILKDLRLNRKISQQKLANDLDVSRSTIAMWESDSSQPDNTMLIRLAKYFSVSTDYLLGNSTEPSSDSKSKYIKIPVLGYVAAGIPTDAVENIIDWEEIPAEMAKNAEYFGLVINGDSMEPRICKGDVVIVRKQSDIDSGDIAIVIIDGERGTCKKVVKHSNGISLVSFNQAYEPMFFTWKEVEQLPIIINGKVVELRGKL
nr:MAG TPA: Repressor protein CI [Caudoviricetes sp.]